MLKRGASGGPIRVVFVLVPRFSLNAFSAAQEPLRLANYVSGHTLYSWFVVTSDGKPVPSSGGVRVTPDFAAAELEQPDNVIVCSGFDAHRYHDPALFGLLRKWAQGGAAVGAVCTASIVLARAGLLDGHPCTIHWELLEYFREAFPHLDARAELYEHDGERFTCAGGSAAADMMLSEITERLGLDMAVQVSEQFLHGGIRSGDDAQRLPVQTRLRVSHPRLVRAIREMENHAEEPLSRDAIAARVGLSSRQLERLFRRHLQTSPARYYLKLRLDRARHLLGHTDMSVTEIALACGFTSASHFSKCYRDLFGHTPRAERRPARRRNRAEAPSVEGGAAADDSEGGLPDEAEAPVDAR